MPRRLLRQVAVVDDRTPGDEDARHFALAGEMRLDQRVEIGVHRVVGDVGLSAVGQGAQRRYRKRASRVARHRFRALFHIDEERRPVAAPRWPARGIPADAHRRARRSGQRAFLPAGGREPARRALRHRSAGRRRHRHGPRPRARRTDAGRRAGRALTSRAASASGMASRCRRCWRMRAGSRRRRSCCCSRRAACGCTRRTPRSWRSRARSLRCSTLAPTAFRSSPSRVGNLFGGASVLACAADRLAMLPGTRIGLSGPKVLESVHGKWELDADDERDVEAVFGAQGAQRDGLRGSARRRCRRVARMGLSRRARARRFRGQRRRHARAACARGSPASRRTRRRSKRSSASTAPHPSTMADVCGCATSAG